MTVQPLRGIWRWLVSFATTTKGPNIAGRDPRTGRIVRLFHPRRHQWQQHFQWDGSRLVGLTAIGRSTIAVLEINLAHRIALRQTLIEEDLFPPELRK